MDERLFKDPSLLEQYLKTLEKKAEHSLFRWDQIEDIQIQVRLDESISPAKFKADPLLPGGYVANSLTIKAMRPNILVPGEENSELSQSIICSCGKEFDLQYWKCCPYCGRKT